jgi:serine phosphatase RsbU (regulator of sigma subunit)
MDSFRPAFNERIESLKGKLQDELSLNERINTLNELSRKLRNRDNKQSYLYAQEALELAQNTANRKIIAIAKANVAFGKYYQEGAIEEAFLLCNEAVPVFEALKYNNGLGEVFGILGVIYWSTGEYEMGFNSLMKALRFSEKADDLSWLSWINYLVGEFYHDLKDYENSLRYHQRALKLFKKIGDIPGHITTIIGIGDIYKALGQFDLALAIHQEALVMSTKHNLVMMKGQAMHEIGMVYLATEQYEDAIDYLNYGLAFRRKVNNQRGEVTGLIYLATAHMELEQYEKAEHLLLQGERLAEINSAKPKLILIYEKLARLYKKLEDPWKAIQYYEQHQDLKAEVMGEEKSTQLKNVNSINSIEKAQQEAEIHKLKNVELKQAYQKIEQQTQSIIDSIHYAKQIQTSILKPIQFMESKFDEMFVFFEPKDIVSGDFYWYAEVDTNLDELIPQSFIPRKTALLKIIAAIDCTGHGVPGAFMVMLANSILNEIVHTQRIFQPAEILTQLDYKVINALRQTEEEETNNDGMDLALATFNEKTGVLTFAGAKNPLFMVRDGELTQIKGAIYPIGGTQYHTSKTYEEHEIKTQPGDTFYIFSDGFQDQFGGKKAKKYLAKRFRKFIASIAHLPMPQQKQEINAELRKWQGYNEQTDDMLIIGFKV